MAEAAESKPGKRTIVEGINLLAQGKRNLLCGEIHQAVNQLEEAARIFGQEYGELANECADVYYAYGQALLELHRSESNILEDETQSDSEEEKEGDDDDDDEKENNDDAASEVSEQGNKSEDIEEEEDVCNAKTSSDEKLDAESRQTSDPPERESVEVVHQLPESSSAKNNSSGDNPEEISNLQLSWETLELAKIIYLRQNSPETKNKLAETYFKLGDVGLEMEQFSDAIKDYETCLEIQKHCLPAENRHIAETLYQLGVAHALNKSYDTAFDHFKGAIKAYIDKRYMRTNMVMELRREKLKKVVDGEIPPDVSEVSDGFYTPLELADKEIEELTGLVKEVQLKIDEVEDEKKNASKVSVLLKESITPTKNFQDQVSDVRAVKPCLLSQDVQEGFADVTMSGNVNDVTHLVRKKRTSEDASDVEVKKIKLGNDLSKDVNGDSSSK